MQSLQGLYSWSQSGTLAGSWFENYYNIACPQIEALHVIATPPSPPACAALFAVIDSASRLAFVFSVVSYDKHVTPNERVTDFRTFVSGVKANHLKGGLRLRQCQEEVAAILKDKVLVGHALSNDLKVRRDELYKA